jgi:hypothetical protein
MNCRNTNPLGYGHSSFVFGQESFVVHSHVKAEDVAPGALVNAMQKGLQYMDIETHLTEVRFIN